MFGTTYYWGVRHAVAKSRGPVCCALAPLARRVRCGRVALDAAVASLRRARTARSAGPAREYLACDERRRTRAARAGGGVRLH